MPTLWRYLLSQYFKVLCLCSVTFVAMLFIMRLEEIARFATLGADGLYVLWFALSQIPYVLPIALPVSCLISATLLFQRISHTHEFTALRASGLGLRDILAPILLAAAFLSCFNFYVVSELATGSHLTTGLVKEELRSINPLFLAQNKHLMRLKGFYFDILGSSRLGESASDIFLAMPNKHNDRLNLLIAKNLQATPSTFTGHGVTLISGVASDTDHHFDHLVLENIERATTSVQDFSQLMQKKIWTLSHDHLQLPFLLIRLDQQKQALALSKQAKAPISELKQIKRDIDRGHTEIVRRLSIAFATFTFTLMGAAFGISISRQRSSKGLCFVLGLATLYLVSYFIAKGVDYLFVTASLFYLLPHLVIIFLSVWALKRTMDGIE